MVGKRSQISVMTNQSLPLPPSSIPLSLSLSLSLSSHLFRELLEGRREKVVGGGAEEEEEERQPAQQRQQEHGLGTVVVRAVVGGGVVQQPLVAVAEGLREGAPRHALQGVRRQNVRARRHLEEGALVLLVMVLLVVGVLLVVVIGSEAV